MKPSAISVTLLTLFAPIVSAWSKEDREIFRVRDELMTHEGPDVTFYSFLGVSPSASLDEINKAYKKKARALHPDKVKQQLAAERAAAQKKKAKEKKGSGGKAGVILTKPPTTSEVKAAVKRASQRQARLSIVTNILRGELRDRYNYFLSNGFPTWKGTEYYYSRYRPGLSTVLCGVFLVAGGGAHYIALYMGWKRQREFIGRYIKHARQQAWGDNFGIPGLETPGTGVTVQPQQQMQQDEDGQATSMNRKQRRMQERDAKKEASKESLKGRRALRQALHTARVRGTSTSEPQAQNSGPVGAKRRVVADNGKVLVVDSVGNVFLQEDHEGKAVEYLLDLDELARPTFRDTAVFRLPVWAYQVTIGRLLSKVGDEAGKGANKSSSEVTEEDDSEPGKHTPSTDSADDFELLEKSVGDLDGETGVATGAQKQGKVGKRKGKKK